MRRYYLQRDRIHERLKVLESAGHATDIFTIVLVLMIALANFVSYIIHDIDYSFLRLSMYIIILVVIFWFIVSKVLTRYKRNLKRYPNC